MCFGEPYTDTRNIWIWVKVSESVSSDRYHGLVVGCVNYSTIYRDSIVLTALRY